jgi:hypothetical protein
VIIIWDDDRSSNLKAERGISLEEDAVLILQKQYMDIAKHPKRPGPWTFVLPIRGYIHVVPVVVDGEGTLVLKTAFPSRKFQKSHGGLPILHPDGAIAHNDQANRRPAETVGNSSLL